MAEGWRPDRTLLLWKGGGDFEQIGRQAAVAVADRACPSAVVGRGWRRLDLDRLRTRAERAVPGALRHPGQPGSVVLGAVARAGTGHHHAAGACRVSSDGVAAARRPVIDPGA